MKIPPTFVHAATLAFLVFVCRVGGLHAEGTKSASPENLAGESNAAPVPFTFAIVNTWPHDPAAFTQGLIFYEGNLLESTGLNGESTFQKTELNTGRVLKTIALPAEYFAEGLTVIGNRAYQLTWQNHRGFIYDATTFQSEGEFSYEGEGWGLTTDGQWLILSDGTDQIRFLDPTSFNVVRTIRVTASGTPIRRINELEWIKGEIFANVWQTNAVIRIDPLNGNVRGVIDFSHLLPPGERKPGTDVLNGIAYDAIGDRIFITGKRWPKLFEVRLIAQPATK